ncbi:MAG: sulfurtransferase TusA family protein [Gammaproteobacteria bacterium]|nr:sulfurtransferase TusA family protein [Gammaproteobacteria bacterium]
MWPFKKPSNILTVVSTVVEQDGISLIDVRGQTCPGYLLAINKAVEKLPIGSVAKLLITYAPCSTDVQAWCKEKNIEFQTIVEENNYWVITIKK